MRTFLAVLTLVAACLAGCGEQAVPGGTARIHMGQDQNGKASYDIITNRDTSIQSLKLDPVTGVLDVQGYMGNGSTLGGQQMAWSIVESNNRTVVLQQMMNLIASAIPFISGGGGTIIPSGSGGLPTVTAASDTPQQAQDRATLLTRIENCPAMNPALKPDLEASVMKAPASFLPIAMAFMNSLSTPAQAAKVSP